MNSLDLIIGAGICLLLTSFMQIGLYKGIQVIHRANQIHNQNREENNPPHTKIKRCSSINEIGAQSCAITKNNTEIIFTIVEKEPLAIWEDIR